MNYYYNYYDIIIIINNIYRLYSITNNIAIYIYNTYNYNLSILYMQINCI